MILTCPACATSYFVPDEAIGPNGRRVRCKSCGHDWRATLEDEPLELSAAAGEPVAEGGFGKREEAPETLAETPAPELPRAFRAKAEQQRKMRRAATQGAAWAGLAAIFLALIGAAFAFRLPIVQAWPQAAAVYELVGAPVNLAGLEFEAIGGATLVDPAKVMVSGALRNIRDNEVVAPPVRVSLRDARGVEIAHRVVRIDAAPVLPGKVQGFAVVIPDPEHKAAGVNVDFVIEPKSEARPAPAAAARPARRPPPAAEEGLRRATGVDMTPKDAQPLDSRPAQGVSAGHG